MTDHKITDDELQRCIECCIKGQVWGDCKKLNCPAIRKQGCHFYLRTDDDYENTIYIEILKDTLALINRQKAEIESLQAVHADMTESLRLAAEANKDMSVELDSMRGAANSYKMHYETAKSEAIKEFAERLIDKCTDPHWCVWMSEIEDLVTEMTENKR